MTVVPIDWHSPHERLAGHNHALAARVHPGCTTGTPEVQLSRRCRSFRATLVLVTGTAAVTDRVHRLSGFPRGALRGAVNHLPTCCDDPSIVV